MKILKSTFTGLILLIVFLLIYGAIIEPRFLLDVTRYDAGVPGLPDSWVDKKVAFMTDFQTGMWWSNNGMVEKAVKQIISEEADLVLIGGDFVYKPDSAVIRKSVAMIRPLLDAGIPVYAVLGNHDYSMMKKESRRNDTLASYLESQLKGLGARVLKNEAVQLGEPGSTVSLVGLGSEWAGQSDVRTALSGLDPQSPRIIFMHNPVSFRDLGPDSGPLTLAGHTHGGQLRLPLLPSESWLDIAREREVIADGWSSESLSDRGNRLYVSKGIGFSLIPVRLFCRPELTIFTLQQADGYMPQQKTEKEDK